jgi:hypothetical protein
VWIVARRIDVANPDGLGGNRGLHEPLGQTQGPTPADWSGEGPMADAAGFSQREPTNPTDTLSNSGTSRIESRGPGTRQLADTEGVRRTLEGQRRFPEVPGPGSTGSDGGAIEWPSRPGEPQHAWEAPRLLELPLGGTTDGLPVRLVRAANRDAVKAYGNAVVPQIPEAIARAILSFT